MSQPDWETVQKGDRVRVVTPGRRTWVGTVAEFSMTSFASDAERHSIGVIPDGIPEHANVRPTWVWREYVSVVTTSPVVPAGACLSALRHVVECYLDSLTGDQPLTQEQLVWLREFANTLPEVAS